MQHVVHFAPAKGFFCATTSTLTKILQYLRPRTGTVTGIMGIFDMILAHFFTDPKWPSHAKSKA
jgi:hypothetical protein